ncbi:MAG: hypothetical protein ACREDH_12250 [Methylocella sp.]
MARNSLPNWMLGINDPDAVVVRAERVGQPGSMIPTSPGGTPQGIDVGGNAQGGVPIQVPDNAAPSPSDTRLAPDQLERLLRGIWRRGDLFMQPFVTLANPIRLRPAEKRNYFFLQNQSAATQIVLGIGQPPGPAGVAPVNGLVIDFNLGFYEPLVIPQGEIWVGAAVVGTPGILLYSV